MALKGSRFKSLKCTVRRLGSKNRGLSYDDLGLGIRNLAVGKEGIDPLGLGRGHYP